MKNKYKRKLVGNIYTIREIDWIKEQILKTYHTNFLVTHPNFISDMERKMFIHKDKSNYGTDGYIFFSLEGSPPKGCAIYQPDHKFIIIIDAWGKTKKYNDTIINKEELTKYLILQELEK